MDALCQRMLTGPRFLFVVHGRGKEHFEKSVPIGLVYGGHAGEDSMFIPRFRIVSKFPAS